MRLSRYIRADFVLTDLAADGVEDAVDSLASHLASLDVVPEQADLAGALLDRERAHTTSMGQGMALPHATIPGLREPILAVAVAPEPVVFGPPESEPVRVFFVLLSPPGGESEHIKLLARICRLARHPDFVESLHSAESREEVVEIIEQVDEQHV